MTKRGAGKHRIAIEGGLGGQRDLVAIGEEATEEAAVLLLASDIGALVDLPAVGAQGIQCGRAIGHWQRRPTRVPEVVAQRGEEVVQQTRQGEVAARVVADECRVDQRVREHHAATLGELVGAVAGKQQVARPRDALGRVGRVAEGMVEAIDEAAQHVGTGGGQLPAHPWRGRIPSGKERAIEIDRVVDTRRIGELLDELDREQPEAATIGRGACDAAAATGELRVCEVGAHASKACVFGSGVTQCEGTLRIEPDDDFPAIGTEVGTRDDEAVDDLRGLDRRGRDIRGGSGASDEEAGQLVGHRAGV